MTPRLLQTAVHSTPRPSPADCTVPLYRRHFFWILCLSAGTRLIAQDVRKAAATTAANEACVLSVCARDTCKTDLLDSEARHAPFTSAIASPKGRLPQAIAHRGYKAAFPENTMAAFKGAVEVGTHAIETDIHVTKDGVVVLSHVKPQSNLLHMSLLRR